MSEPRREAWTDWFQAKARRRLTALRARVSHRFGVVPRAPRDVAISTTFRHPVDANERARLIALYKSTFPRAAHLESEEAKRLAAHHIRLLGHSVEHGDRIAWSLDPVSGRHWSSDYSADIAYRGANRLGDVKLPWELNKHQYFFTLGKAGWVTGQEAFADEIVRQIREWIEQNPYHSGVNWTSALEVGARSTSWILSYPFYRHRTDEAFRALLAEILWRHLVFIEENLSGGSYPNTHLAGEAAALVVGGLFLQGRDSQRWVSLGLRLLEEQILRQVTDDGVHWERSAAYHRFFVDQVYLVDALVRINGLSLTPASLLSLERMTEFLLRVLLPDGTVQVFGDNDDARGIWCRHDAPWEYRSVLALGAVRFNRGDFKYVSGGLTEEVLWLMGPSGVEAFHALESRRSQGTSVAYPDAGYYVMRTGWSDTDSVLTFDAGELGVGGAAHGHADTLSFQLHAAGYSFLVDPGTFSYNLDYSWRNVFRGTKAHNTVVIDGHEQSIPKGRMEWDSMARGVCREWLSTSWFDLVDGEHDGYRRLQDPVSHRRAILFIKPDVWLVWDRFAGQQPHVGEAYFHLKPDCVADTAGNSPDARIVLTAPNGARMWLWAPDVSPDSLQLITGNDEVRDAWHSPEYGVRVSSKLIVVRKEFTGAGEILMCLTTDPHVRPVLRSKESGEMDVTVRRSDAVEDRALLRLGDSQGRVGDDDVSFDGRALLVRRVGGRVAIVAAERFRDLSVAGVVRVEGGAAVRSLLVEEGSCRAVVDHGADLPRITVADSIHLDVSPRLSRSLKYSSSRMSMQRS